MPIVQTLLDKVIIEPLALLLTWVVKKTYGRWKVGVENDKVPVIRIFIDSNYKFSEISDPNFDDKVEVAKYLLRGGAKEFIELKIEPTFKVSNLTKEARILVGLKIEENSKWIKKQFEIMLMRPITLESELPANLKIIFNSLLTRRYADGSGSIKLDVYRNHAPNISFSIWLSDSDLTEIAHRRRVSLSELREDLRWSGMLTAGIFTTEQLLNRVIPKFIWEIYRINRDLEFDLQIKHWESLMLYDVGLG